MKYTCAMMTVLGVLAAAAPAYASNSAVENALARQGDLSVFYQALLTTGVANELNEKTEYTVFAPTNEAFTEITPRDYPCFYSVQCRGELAVVLRNHIVPKNESVNRFSKWGGGIPTVGDRRLYVEETYKGQYEAEGKSVLYQDASSEALRTQGEGVSLYQIDGVIASDQELSAFRTIPVANTGMVTRKTVTTTYRTVPAPASVSGWYLVPGGYPNAPVVVVPDESSNDATETTTETHTRTTQ